MSHYTLGWHDQQNKHFEIGEYADDAWEAVRHAREDVPYLHEHPFSLDSIKRRNNEKFTNLYQQPSYSDSHSALQFMHLLITLGYEKI